MFWWLKSIRTKLTLWYSFILLTTLGAFCLIAYTYSSQQLSDNLDRSLRNEVKWVKNFIESKSSKVKPSKKFSRQPKPSQQSDQQSAVSDDKSAADADDIVWDQIYEHALVNPKKTIIEVTNKYGAISFRSFPAEAESLDVGEVPLN